MDGEDVGVVEGSDGAGLDLEASCRPPAETGPEAEYRPEPAPGQPFFPAAVSAPGSP
jgi:hypothetical protein